MAHRLSRSALVLLALFVGCALHHTRAPADACWTSDAPIDYIIRPAANVLIAAKGPTWDRMRALASVPLVLDSIRAHSRVVTDQGTCARLWLALDKHDRGPRIAVVQIGQTFWTRSADGMTAFDNAYRWVAGFVDQ
jgi:hypothetical protein